MKRVITIFCLATCLSCFAQWTKKVDFTGEPDVYKLFEEVARMERGIVRFVTVDAMEAQLNDAPTRFDDVNLDFLPEENYFNVHIGEDDGGSGDGTWQILQGKVWWAGSEDAANRRCYLGSILIDHSPQQEYRYFYFYEYNPQSGMLTNIPKPIDVGYEDSELQYDIKSNGTIEVKRWGEPLCILVWDGSKFQCSNKDTSDKSIYEDLAD